MPKKLDFPIRTSDSRIVRFCCLQHNKFDAGGRPNRERKILAAKSRETAFSVSGSHVPRLHGMWQYVKTKRENIGGRAFFLVRNLLVSGFGSPIRRIGRGRKSGLKKRRQADVALKIE